MAFKRRSWKRRLRKIVRRIGFGRKPRSYKAFYSRRKRRVSYRTNFKSRGGILR